MTESTQTLRPKRLDARDQPHRNDHCGTYNRCDAVNRLLSQYEAEVEAVTLVRKSEDEDVALMESASLEMLRESHQKRINDLRQDAENLLDCREAARQYLADIEEQIDGNARQQVEAEASMTRDLEGQIEMSKASQSRLQGQRGKKDWDRSIAFIAGVKRVIEDQHTHHWPKRQRMRKREIQLVENGETRETRDVITITPADKELGRTIQVNHTESD